MRKPKKPKLVLLCLAMSCLLLPSCALNWEKAQSDLQSGLADARKVTGVLATKLEAAESRITDVAAKVNAKVEKSREDLRSHGAPVDGSAADIMKWATENPVTAFGSSGSLLTYLAYLLVTGKKKKEELSKVKEERDITSEALTTLADAVKELPPDAEKVVRDAVAAHPLGTSDVRAEIARAAS